MSFFAGQTTEAELEAPTDPKRKMKLFFYAMSNTSLPSTHKTCSLFYFSVLLLTKYCFRNDFMTLKNITFFHFEASGCQKHLIFLFSLFAPATISLKKNFILFINDDHEFEKEVFSVVSVHYLSICPEVL